jgi:hypothetical protein
MTRTCLAASFALALAACGGKAAPTTPTNTGGAGGRVAAPGTVLGDPAVYAKAKASTIALPAGYDQTMLCEGAATLGELMTKWEADLGGAINASCDGAKCRVDVASKPDPACDTATDVEGCDGSAMMLEFEVDDAGAIVPTSLMCMGAG